MAIIRQWQYRRATHCSSRGKYVQYGRCGKESDPTCTSTDCTEIAMLTSFVLHIVKKNKQAAITDVLNYNFMPSKHVFLIILLKSASLLYFRKNNIVKSACLNTLPALMALMIFSAVCNYIVKWIKYFFN